MTGESQQIPYPFIPVSRSDGGRPLDIGSTPAGMEEARRQGELLKQQRIDRANMVRRRLGQEREGEAEATDAVSPGAEIVGFVGFQLELLRFDAMVQVETTMEAKQVTIKAIERHKRGEITGSVDPDTLMSQFERLVGQQLPTKYPLPSHLHWMGDGVHDNYRGPRQIV